MNHQHTHDYKTAIFYAVASVLAFSLMSVCIKFLTEHHSVVEIIFFRCFFAFIPVLYMMHKQNAWRALVKINISSHLARSLIGVFAMGMGFASFAYLPLTDATVLGFIAPIGLTLLSVPLLNEQVGAWRWSAVIIGFAGVILMMQPWASEEAGDAQLQYVGLALGLCSAIMSALAMIIVKKMGETEPSIIIVFYFMLISTICAAAFLPIYWKQPENLMTWLAFIGSGITGGVGQILSTRSYQYAPAAIISPFNYLSIIFAVIFGFFIFGEQPEIWTLLGGMVVVGSGLLILYREVLLKKDTSKINPMSIQPTRPNMADFELLSADLPIEQKSEETQKPLDASKSFD